MKDVLYNIKSGLFQNTFAIQPCYSKKDQFQSKVPTVQFD